MERIYKIIIICLVAAIIAIGGAIAMTLMKEPVKTVELFENGTTVEVPETAKLQANNATANTYLTDKNTTVMGIDNADPAGAALSMVISKAIADKGVRMGNGLYKLDKKSLMELSDEFALGYDEKSVEGVVVGVMHNNTINQSVIVFGSDEKEMVSVLDSIQWKKGIQSNATLNATAASSDDKTFPFYADDGSIIGYYHVWDVVSHYDGLYQLQPNGEWVYIGPNNNAVSQDHSANTDDSDYDDQSGDDFHEDYGDEYDIDLEGDDYEPYIETTSD